MLCFMRTIRSNIKPSQTRRSVRTRQLERIAPQPGANRAVRRPVGKTWPAEPDVSPRRNSARASQPRKGSGPRPSHARRTPQPEQTRRSRGNAKARQPFCVDVTPDATNPADVGAYARIICAIVARSASTLALDGAACSAAASPVSVEDRSGDCSVSRSSRGRS